MIEQEASDMLRRFYHWREGGDLRSVNDAFPAVNGVHGSDAIAEAIMFFASKGTPIDCGSCRHCVPFDGADSRFKCGLNVKGDCKSFEEKER